MFSFKRVKKKTEKTPGGLSSPQLVVIHLQNNKYVFQYVCFAFKSFRRGRRVAFIQLVCCVVPDDQGKKD